MKEYEGSFNEKGVWIDEDPEAFKIKHKHFKPNEKLMISIGRRKRTVKQTHTFFKFVIVPICLEGYGDKTMKTQYRVYHALCMKFLFYVDENGLNSFRTLTDLDKYETWEFYQNCVDWASGFYGMKFEEPKDLKQRIMDSKDALSLMK